MPHIEIGSTSPGKTDRTTYVLIGIAICVVTVGILAIGYFMFQGLDEHAEQIKSMKVMKNTQISPIVELGGLIEQKASLDESHPRCEELYRMGDLAYRKLDFKQAADYYQKSIDQYRADQGSATSTGISDNLHVSTRYDALSLCYSHLNEPQKALEFASLAYREYPSQHRLNRRADIYQSMGMTEQAIKDRETAKGMMMPSVRDALR